MEKFVIGCLVAAFYIQGFYFWFVGVAHMAKTGQLFFAAISAIVFPIGYVAGVIQTFWA